MPCRAEYVPAGENAAWCVPPLYVAPHTTKAEENKQATETAPTALYLVKQATKTAPSALVKQAHLGQVVDPPFVI